MNNMLNRIYQMHRDFGIGGNKGINLDEKKFRICAMQEELDEYREANSKEEELDALIDLVVFALGTAEREGWLGVFEQGFDRVMDANCAKELGGNAKRGNFKLDLVKPEGWTAPKLDDLIKEVEDM